MPATYANLWGPDPVINSRGDSLAGALAYVYESDGTTPATLYTDKTKGTTATNPVVVDANGNLAFWTVPGAYVLAITWRGVEKFREIVVVEPHPDENIETTNHADTTGNETITGSWDFTGGIAESGTALSAKYARLHVYDPANYGASLTDVEVQAALNAIVTDAVDSAVLDLRGRDWALAATLTWDPNAADLTVLADGATVTYSGSAVMFKVDDTSGGGGSDRGPEIIGGRWIGTASATVGFQIIDTSRTHFEGCYIHGFSAGMAVELRNENSYTEQTTFHRCIIGSSKHAVYFSPQSVTLGSGGTESFARTRMTDCVVSGGVSGEHLIVMNGDVYGSTFVNVGGNLAAGASVFYLNGGHLGTVIGNISYEGGNASSRIFTKGPSIGANEPLIHSISSDSITVTSSTTLGYPFRTFGSELFIGTTTASTGNLRLPASGIVRARKGDNSADIEYLRISGDALLIGGFAEPSEIQLHSPNILVDDGQIEMTDGGPIIKVGSGSPEGSVTAKPGSVYSRTDGASAGVRVYIKESGTGNTGWKAVPQRLTATAAWDPPSIADGASATTTVSVTGALVADTASASLSTLGTSGAFLVAQVTAVDTVSVTLVNRSGGTINPVNGTLRVNVYSYVQ